MLIGFPALPLCCLVAHIVRLDFSESLLSFVERNDAVRQAYEHKRAGVTDTPMHAIFKLPPMGRRFTKLIRDKFVGECLSETEGIGLPSCLLVDESALFAGGIVAPVSQRIEIVEVAIIKEPSD
jgi:hypothetical protein